MMKGLSYLLLCALIVNQNSVAHVPIPNTFILCSLSVYKHYKKKLEEMNLSDKFMHCSMSCALAAKCGPQESLMLGVLKEMGDLMGYGNAEVKDLIADTHGVKIGMPYFLKIKKTENVFLTCEDSCSCIYPE